MNFIFPNLKVNKICSLHRNQIKTYQVHYWIKKKEEFLLKNHNPLLKTGHKIFY
jgi:hypothetical protein